MLGLSALLPVREDSGFSFAVTSPSQVAIAPEIDTCFGDSF